jgi:hypothetical protein
VLRSDVRKGELYVRAAVPSLSGQRDEETNLVHAGRARRVISIDCAKILFHVNRTHKQAGNRPSTRLPTLWCIIGLTTALITMVGARDACAVPFTPFRYEAQAQRHCPADTVVWLDFRKHTYYSKGQKHYARGLHGSFVCRSEARAGGYRRSVFGVR